MVRNVSASTPCEETVCDKHQNLSAHTKGNYSELTDMENLYGAYLGVRGPKKAAGVDGTTFPMIESQPGGEITTLKTIQEELANGSFKPSPVKRVFLSKPGGGKRPLGIPVIADRVVQRAITNMLMPEVDPLFADCSFAYRPNRSAQMAVKQVMKNLEDGYIYVFDADISKFFDSLPHKVIIDTLRQYRVDKKLIRLIRKFIKAPIVLPPVNGHSRIISSKSGTPQGGGISPLLANMCLDKLDKFVESLAGTCEFRMVRYADDFLIMFRFPLDLKATCLLEQVASFLNRKLRLYLNPSKTSVFNVSDSPLDYLGFQFRSVVKDGCARIVCAPNSGKMERLYQELVKLSSQHFDGLKAKQAEIHSAIRNWENYYGIYEGEIIAQELRDEFV